MGRVITGDVRPAKMSRGQRYCYHEDCADQMKKEAESDRSKAKIHTWNSSNGSSVNGEEKQTSYG